MAVRSTVSVDGYGLPEPTKYDATISSFVDSGRNAQGYMIGSEIRGNIAKISLQYAFLTANELAYILQLFSSAHGGAFIRNVTFLDMVSNSFQTRQMYISDRTGGMLSRNPDTGLVDGYSGIKFSLVEV